MKQLFKDESSHSTCQYSHKTKAKTMSTGGLSWITKSCWMPFNQWECGPDSIGSNQWNLYIYIYIDREREREREVKALFKRNI